MEQQIITIKSAVVKPEVVNDEVVFTVEKTTEEQDINGPEFLDNLVTLSLQRFMIRKSKEMDVEGLSKRFYSHI